MQICGAAADHDDGIERHQRMSGDNPPASIRKNRNRCGIPPTNRPLTGPLEPLRVRHSAWPPSAFRHHVPGQPKRLQTPFLGDPDPIPIGVLPWHLHHGWYAVPVENPCSM